MKTIINIICLLFFIVRISNGQISGPDTVCSGYIYSYNANIVGADSISWTFPNGWHVLSNSGMQVNVLCNHDVGQVCATGFDSLGNNMGQQCLPVHWGGSGAGWHVITNNVGSNCHCPIYSVSVVPTGGNVCGTCTEGTLSPNLKFAVYNAAWPFGFFVAYADGASPITGGWTSSTYYVYQVDITFGIQNAILIDGGLCPVTIQNTFPTPTCVNEPLFLAATPSPVCIGDTLTIQYTHNQPAFFFNVYTWTATQGNVTFISPQNIDHIQCIIDSAAPVTIQLEAYPLITCPFYGTININYITCAPPLPVASFQSNTSGICVGSCVNFQNTSTDATSYQWSFPGGTPSTDTTENPQGICYFNSGAFDVILIANNAVGSDTLILPNYLTVHQQIAFTPITQNGDTLFSAPGYSSYQWYFDSTLISGANNFYYVAHQSGDYSVIVEDSNGCQATAYLVNVIATSNDMQSLINNLSVNFSDDIIYLNLTSTISSSSYIQLLDVFGREVSQNKIILKNGINEIEFLTNNISSGIYFIKINFAGRLSTFKFYLK